MTRSVGTSIENAFTKGLITEVTGVNSPESSVTSTLNVVYDRRGAASKRKSFRLEPSGSPVDVSADVLTGNMRTEFLWEAVGGVGTRTFAVLQIGSHIKFFDSTGPSVTGGEKAFTIEMTDYKVPGFSDIDVGNLSAYFTSGKGYLFIVHPICEPIYVKYDAGTDTISVSEIQLRVRDLQGVSDGLPTDQRPATLSTEHHYNLFNQGWYATGPVGAEAENSVQVLSYWDSERSDFPSNVDIWWYYLVVSQSSGQETLAIDPGDFSTNVSNKLGLYGNTPAPRGHYIINAFETNRTGESGVSGVPESSSEGFRPSVVAFYAGRAFYAGVQASDFSSTIYFSQIIERDEQLGRCYQANDPTSREQFDLLDSDGGTVKIQDIGNVIDLRVVGNALMVFATNGVWSISGTDNGTFKATDYSVSKITSYPAISKSSIVDVGGTPIWWNYEGIFSLKSDTVGLVTDVISLTATTIKTYYDETIPDASKVLAKGSYNDQSGLVYWLWKSTTSGVDYDYDRILVLDTVTLAFYILTTPNDEDRMTGLFSPRGSDGKVFKFVKVSPTFVLSIVEMTGEDYLDYSGIPYDAEFITGYRIRGNLMNKFQTNYLTVITDATTTESSCFVQGLWDYSNSPDSGRYTNPQQVYKTASHRDYHRAKIKMRGNGRSLQFRFFGEFGKPFVVVGWAGFESAENVP